MTTVTAGRPLDATTPTTPGRTPCPPAACCPPRRPPTCSSSTRDIATRELAPQVGRGRGHRDVPARGVPRRWAGPGCSGCPTPRSTAAAASPTRSTCRCSRRSPRSGPSVGVGVSVHALSCFGLATRGTEEQKARVAARHARRRAARRLLPLRAARRLRPGRDEDHGAPRRRRLRAQRRQGVDHPRRPRRLLQGDGADLRRPQRHLLLPGPGRHRRASAPTRRSARWA